MQENDEKARKEKELRQARLVLLGVAIASAAAVGGILLKQHWYGPEACAMEAVKRDLKDPWSVRFRNVDAAGGHVSGEYNAKNSFGAYAGWTRFHADASRPCADVRAIVLDMTL